MPNWVTNKIKAPSHVIGAMLNEKGRIDFGNIVPFGGEWSFDGVYSSSEALAERVINKPLSDNPLLRGLEELNRRDSDLKKLGDEEFEQFVQMLRNYRKCGFLHHMDFARERWGTKWNACESVADVGAGTAAFKTAWSCPKPVLEDLSRRFPADAIEARYADEDIGRNCGSFTLKAGQYIASDIASAWSEQSDDQKAKWKAFACDLTGRDLSDYEDDKKAA